MTDNINHPTHYNQGQIECIEALDSLGIADDFALGNAIKYLWRSRFKGVEVADLQKARWYIDWLIQKLEKPNQPSESTPKALADDIDWILPISGDAKEYGRQFKAVVEIAKEHG